MKASIRLFMLCLVFSLNANASSDWTMTFKGDGWEVRDVSDHPELQKIAENTTHGVGIFVSQKPINGSIDDMVAMVNSKSDQKTAISEVNGQRAIQVFGPHYQDGKRVEVWGVMFVRNGQLTFIQAIYDKPAGKTFLEPTINSFCFIEKKN